MARNSLKSVKKLIDSVTMDLPPEKSFLDQLKRSIELTDQKNSRLPSKTYKPSSMNCLRNMYFQVTGTEPDTQESRYSLVGICNSGTDIHERVQTAIAGMKDNGIDCEYINVAEFVRQRGLEEVLEIREQKGMETKLYHKTYNMSFMTDGIIKYNNHYYIVELKTETAYKWQSRQGVDPKHYAQGTAYSLAFNIPEVIFVYISRDTLDMKSFMFVPTGEQKMDLVGKITTCDEYVNKKSVPPYPENKSAKLCQYCSYKGTCKEV